MKHLWKYGLLLLCSFSLQTFAESNIPTDDTIKQQFAKQSDGMMYLDHLTLHQLDAVGNQATYSVEGNIASKQDLYTIVESAGDYLFYERTWTKDHPVKFSAMMTAIGTQASGWRISFFSMQMAAKMVGRPFEKGEDLSKMLVVNDSDFMTRFAKLDSKFAVDKATIQKQKGEYASLKTQAEALDKKIAQSWGKDKSGKPIDRSAIMQAMLQKMYAIDKQNDPLLFENNYNKNTYEPALAACQKKADCDEVPLRTARDDVLQKQRSEYYQRHNEMSAKIKADMAALDKKIEPLRKQRGELSSQMVALELSNGELERDYKFWLEATENLRKEGFIQ